MNNSRLISAFSTGLILSAAVGASAAEMQLVVGSKPGPTASFTFLADPALLSESTAPGYSALNWGGLDPQAATAANTVYIGAGGQIFRYSWDGAALTETGSTSNAYGTITNMVVAGNGDLLVNSRDGGGNNFTFVVDPTTMAEKIGYTPLVWGSSKATAVTAGPGGGNDVYFGQTGIIYRYNWDGSSFTPVSNSTNIWGSINSLALAGNGDLLVNSTGATFAADPVTFADKSGSNYLNWSSLTPTATTLGPGNGDNVWIGAGGFLFLYSWNGTTFTEQAGTGAIWGDITNLAVVQVPEPAGIALLAIGSGLILRRRRA